MNRQTLLATIEGRGKWSIAADVPGVQLMVTYIHPSGRHWAELVVWEGEKTKLIHKHHRRQVITDGSLYPDPVFWDGFYEVAHDLERCVIAGQTAPTIEQLVADAEAWVESFVGDA